jgi:cyclic pyranopterin phosphate synthase
MALETIDLIGACRRRGGPCRRLPAADHVPAHLGDRPLQPALHYCMPEAGLPWIPKAEILVRRDRAHRARGGRLRGRAQRAPDRRRAARAARTSRSSSRRLAAIDGHRRHRALDQRLAARGARRESSRGAGLRRVNVSLDTLRPERFPWRSRGGPGLERVLAGIDAAIAAGLAPLKLNCVVMRGVNDDELADFAANSTRERASSCASSK